MRPILLSPLVFALGVLAMCAVPVVVIANRCSPAVVESPDVVRARRAAYIHAIYERVTTDRSIDYFKTPWMCRTYHVRLQRDERGQVLLSRDGHVQNATGPLFDDLPNAKGKRISLVLRDVDGDGRPDEYAGPAFYPDEDAPLFSLSPAPFRRVDRALATEVNETWDRSMDEFVRRYLPHDGAGRPRVPGVK